MTDSTISSAVEALGAGPLTEQNLVQHIHPLFSRVLSKSSDAIYLANHSLGRPLDQTAQDVAESLGYWYTDLDAAWDHWLAEIERFRARTAQLIEWSGGDAIVPKTCAGQGLRAVLNALPMSKPRILSTTAEFDSIDFILRSYAAQNRAVLDLVEPDDQGLISTSDLADAIKHGTDLVVISLVYYATGQMLEGLGQLIERAHKYGALVLLDTYHAAGTVPIPPEARDADFLIGGSYKYTRGGPGACWLAIHPEHLEQDSFFTLDTGWFARKEPFAFSRGSLERGQRGDAWLESTPPVLPFYQARAGQQLTLALGVDRLREYSLQQQGALAQALARADVPTRLIQPRGAFLLIPSDNVAGDTARLRSAGVISDGRPCPSGNGGYIRLCPDILNTVAEINDAAARIAYALPKRAHT